MVVMLFQDLPRCYTALPFQSVPTKTSPVLLTLAMRFPKGILSIELQAVLRRFWRVAGGTPSHIVVPATLSVTATFLEGLSYGMLIPLSNAVSGGGFDFLSDSGLFSWIGALLPASAVTSPKRDAYLILIVVGLVLTARIAKLGLDYLHARYMNWRNALYQARLKEHAFARVMSFGRQYFEHRSVGHVHTELSWATSPISIWSAAEEIARRLLSISAKAVVMAALSPILFAIALIGFPLVQSALGWIHRSVKRLAGEQAALERTTQSRLFDLLSTMPLVKATNQEGEATSGYGAILDQSRELSVRRRNIASLRWPVEEVLVLGLILVAQATLVISVDTYSTGDVVQLAAFLLLLQQILPDLRKYGALRISIAEQVPRLEALAELFRDEGKFSVTSGERTFDGLRREIEVKGLDFSYVEGVRVLDDVSVVIPAGVMTAIVGESGSGKTTFADILARFYECPPGTVFLDGVDIRDFSTESLYQHVAVVSQEVWLLNRSLRDNLLFGLDRTPDDSELIELLEALGFSQWLAEYAAPLDVDIGDRGVQLSGGQRQRLAIARALLRDPGILILDEATSALDSIMEEHVASLLASKATDRTMIVIAHRLSTIRNADQILVMNSGKVVERGTWDELVSTGGDFARLVAAQFGSMPIQS